MENHEQNSLDMPVKDKIYTVPGILFYKLTAFSDGIMY